MTTAVHGFMSGDLLRTPSMLDAGLHTERNIFDDAFRPDSLIPTGYDGSHAPPGKQYDFFHGGAHDGLTPHFGYAASTPSYPTSGLQPHFPALQSQTAGKAAQPKPDWAQNPSSQFIEPEKTALLPPLMTLSPTPSTWFQYGQATPPDDDLPPDFCFSEESRDTVQGGGLAQATPEDSASVSSRPSQKRKRSPTASKTGSVAAPAAAISPKRARRAPRGKRANAEAEGKPELEKRNKFLERNRVAASKCRQKKKQWVSELEDRSRDLQSMRNHLTLNMQSLRDEVLYLKNELLRHETCSDPVIQDFIANMVVDINKATKKRKADSEAISSSGMGMTRTGSIQSIGDAAGGYGSHSMSRGSSSVLDSLGMRSQASSLVGSPAAAAAANDLGSLNVEL